VVWSSERLKNDVHNLRDRAGLIGPVSV